MKGWGLGGNIYILKIIFEYLVNVLFCYLYALYDHNFHEQGFSIVVLTYYLNATLVENLYKSLILVTKNFKEWIWEILHYLLYGCHWTIL